MRQQTIMHRANKIRYCTHYKNASDKKWVLKYLFYKMPKAVVNWFSNLGMKKNWKIFCQRCIKIFEKQGLLCVSQGSLIKIFVSSDGSESDSDRNTCRERCIVPLIHRRRYRLCFHRC